MANTRIDIYMTDEGSSFERKRFADDPEWGVTRGLPTEHQQRLKDELRRVFDGALDIDDSSDPDQLMIYALWRRVFSTYDSLDEALVVVDAEEARHRAEFDVERDRIWSSKAQELHHVLIARREDWIDTAESVGMTVPEVLAKIKDINDGSLGELDDKFESILTMNLKRRGSGGSRRV